MHAWGTCWYPRIGLEMFYRVRDSESLYNRGLNSYSYSVILLKIRKLMYHSPTLEPANPTHTTHFPTRFRLRLIGRGISVWAKAKKNLREGRVDENW